MKEIDPGTLNDATLARRINNLGLFALEVESELIKCVCEMETRLDAIDPFKANLHRIIVEDVSL